MCVCVSVCVYILIFYVHYSRSATKAQRCKFSPVADTDVTISMQLESKKAF